MNKQQLSIQPSETCDCGGEFVQGTKKRTVTYKGQTSDEFEMPGFYCQECDEGIVDLRDMILLNQVMDLLKASVQADKDLAA